MVNAMPGRKLIIYGTLCGLNDYTKANRANRYAGANLKKKMEDLIGFHIAAQLKDSKFKDPVKLDFYWYEPNRKRDLDNVCFAKKFILDSLVKNGIIENDDWKHVRGFTDSFFVDKDNPRIEVTIEEVRDGDEVFQTAL